MTKLRANFDRIRRCAFPPPIGAEIRKTRSAGPSAEPKSTGFESRAKVSVGTSTWLVRQCGIATPPGTPVADFDSRVKASEVSPSASSARPATAACEAKALITASLVSPGATSSMMRSGVITGGSEEFACVPSAGAVSFCVGLFGVDPEPLDDVMTLLSRLLLQR